MSDYTKTTNFTAKDSLSTGDPLKLIKGSYFDTEFDAIVTAIATKYDTNDIASQAQAEAEASGAVLMTPLATSQWADANAGMVGDIQALTDPGADTLLGWDDSASAAIGFTLGAGLKSTLTVLSSDDAAIDHDALLNFVADEHVAHSGITLTAGSGLSGGGTIDASRSFALDISGLTAISGSGVIGTDGYLVDDGGTMKRMSHQAAGIPKISDATTAPTPSSAQVNSYWSCSNAGAITFTLNTSVGEAGNIIVIEQAGVGQVTVAGTATVNSAASTKATRAQYSVIVLYCTAANTWTLYGDAI